MRTGLHRLRVRNATGFFFGVVGALSCFVTLRSEEALTNVAQLRRASQGASQEGHFIRIEGDVWWANPAQGRFVLQDGIEAQQFETDLQGQSLEAGRRVRLTGHSTVLRNGPALRLGSTGCVVDNDGVHGMAEKSGSVFLNAGRWPLRLEWFNGVEGHGLEVEYEGPGISRQPIPPAALFREQTNDATGQTQFVNGLDFDCYEFDGEVLPDFSSSQPVKSGVTDRFDTGVLSRAEHAGVRYSGWLSVPRDGLYTFHLKSDDGSKLFLAAPPLRVEVVGDAGWPRTEPVAIGQTLRAEDEGRWSRVEGRVTFVRQSADGTHLELGAGASRLRVEVADPTGLAAGSLLNRRIAATGFCESAATVDGQSVPGRLLVPGREQIEILAPTRIVHDDAVDGTNRLPLLTTAVEVHRLKREQAQRRYPVRLRGVVTCVFPEHQAFTLQDSTRGLYVEDHGPLRTAPPQIGDFVEVEGATDPSLFAPIVAATRVTSLGLGQMPDPVLPTWEQLMNGSLDAQFVEIQGIVTAVQSNTVTMLVRGGILKAELRVNGLGRDGLAAFENALVRVRACLFASWDYVTHQVMMGELRLYGADIFVDQPAPADVFSTPAKSAAQLRQFDPQAGVFQRVKVAGQIVFIRDQEYFMMDGADGIRFLTKEPATLRIGDKVEVVGFPELFGSASPVLREAVARKSGDDPLPPPVLLSLDDLVNARHDATLVRVEGTLVGVRATPAEQLLEMQSGVRSFVARLGAAEDSVRSLTPGSRLELTGVYCGLGGDSGTGRDIAAFELLLASASGVKVLARPPWWTLRRLLIAVGALACVLVVTVLWITQLHRKVEERTTELESQIRERQRIEQQRALEQERSRVAQDLHDDLGAGLTEISVLGKQARSRLVNDHQRNQYLEEMDEKSRQMVGALDEIVWAMSHSQDTLDSLVSYLCLHADRFLGLSGISWQLDGGDALPSVPINSLCRHELFLAFKEALTNVVRHSGATEVRFHIEVRDDLLHLSVADNGRGINVEAPPAGASGLANMRTRMEKLGGRFEIQRPDGGGTVLHFYAPTHIQNA